MVLSTLRFHCLMNLGRGRKGGGGGGVGGERGGGGYEPLNWEDGGWYCQR